MVRGKVVCVWTEDGSYSCWETGCGQSFCLEDGTPKDNSMKFCCFCGEKLRERKAK